MRESTGLAENDPIPFEVFAEFERLESVNPIIACEPPEWAAAAHAFVMDDTVHYLWGAEKRRQLLGFDAQHGSGERSCKDRARSAQSRAFAFERGV